MTILNPYITFRDGARDAITFYHGVFGGEIMLSTFGDYHASEDPAEVNKIMHGQLTSPNGLVLMVADVPNSMDYTPGDNISVSLSGGDIDELTRYWNGLLAEGGTVTVPFEVAPWGDRFGMLVDRFGIHWLLNGSAPAA